MTALVETARPTIRARRPTIRVAQPHEGSVVQALCVANKDKIADWLDWTKPLGLNWLIAELDRPVGCIMVNYGAPIGRISFLIVPPGLSHRQRALVVRDLSLAGCEALHRHGSQVAAIMTAEDTKSWARVVQRRGSVALATGTLYLKRL